MYEFTVSRIRATKTRSFELLSALADNRQLDSWSWTSMKKRIGRPGQILERGTEGENAGLKLRSGRPSSSSEQAIRIPRQILQPNAGTLYIRRSAGVSRGRCKSLRVRLEQPAELH